MVAQLYPYARGSDFGRGEWVVVSVTIAGIVNTVQFSSCVENESTCLHESLSWSMLQTSRAFMITTSLLV